MAWDIEAAAEEFLRETVYAAEYRVLDIRRHVEGMLLLPEEDRRRALERFADHYRSGTHTQEVGEAAEDDRARR